MVNSNAKLVAHPFAKDVEQKPTRATSQSNSTDTVTTGPTDASAPAQERTTTAQGPTITETHEQARGGQRDPRFEFFVVLDASPEVADGVGIACFLA